MYTWGFDILVLAELGAKSLQMESCSYVAVAQRYNMAIGTREMHDVGTSSAQLQFLNSALRVSRSQPTRGKTFNLFLGFHYLCVLTSACRLSLKQARIYPKYAMRNYQAGLTKLHTYYAARMTSEFSSLHARAGQHRASET